MMTMTVSKAKQVDNFLDNARMHHGEVAKQDIAALLDAHGGNSLNAREYLSRAVFDASNLEPTIERTAMILGLITLAKCTEV